MNKFSSIFLIVATLLLASCSASEQSESQQNSDSSSSQKTETAESKKASNSNSEKEAKAVENKTEAEGETEEKTTDNKPSDKTTQKTASVSGLIPSTNPNQRQQKIAKGRPDPFGFVSVPLALKGTLPQPSTPPVTRQPRSPELSNRPIRRPTKRPTTPSVPVAPPQPELAQAITITGIIDLGGAPQIIVKAPEERVSRYVRVGDYLSNGQVRVKRIENVGGSSPVVVLEQLGQEVYKQIGDNVAAPPSEPSQPPQTIGRL
jgi:hypothetical protein